MKFEATYKDQSGNLVAELIEGSNETARRHCEKQIKDNPNKGFILVEVK